MFSTLWFRGKQETNVENDWNCQFSLTHMLHVFWDPQQDLRKIVKVIAMLSLTSTNTQPGPALSHMVGTSPREQWLIWIEILKLKETDK